MTHENSAVQQITNNNLVVIALDSLSVTKLKEMTSYLKGACIYVGKQPFGFSLWCLFFTILVHVYRDSWDLHLCFNGFQKRI